MSTEPKPIEIAGIRRRLETAGGRTYWKSLEELANTQAFRELVEREFPHAASEWDDPQGRRDFLRVMGASLALAGVTACTRQPEETIVPYVRAPEDIVPGKPLFFATALRQGGFGRGVLVESHMGRPTKIEGNPDHPGSLGAADIFMQAEILSLYDPDRSQTLKYRGEVRIWADLLSELRTALEKQRASGGAGLRFLTGTVTSPSLHRQIESVLADFPNARWHQYEPVGRDNARAGAIQAFGDAVETHCRLEKADVVLSLDADFLGGGPDRLRLVRGFSSRRKVAGGNATGLNRLYTVESTPTLTGARADHRLPLKAAEIESFARAVATAVGVDAGGERGGGDRAAWVDAVAEDLKAHRGSGAVLVGEWQPPAVHALAHAINAALGNIGSTIFYTKPVDARPEDHTASLRELARAMGAGEVEILAVLDANPAYDAPADLKFADALGKVPFRLHLGLYEDETAELSHWHVPMVHDLETWSDVRAADGTISLVQPLIAPLYGGKSVHELLAAFGPRPTLSSYDVVRETWKARLPGGDFEKAWRRVLHDGVVTGSAQAEAVVALKAEAVSPAAPGAAAFKGLEIVFRPDPTVHDGRYANNGWLQELPKPLSKLTWDNAAMMAKATADGLHLQNGDVVELTLAGRKVTAPVWILPGVPEGSVTLHLGYGRTRSGRVGTAAGANAYALRGSDAPWFASGLEVRKTGRRTTLACTQDHWSMEGRNLVRSVSAETFAHEPDAIRHMGHEPGEELSMFPLPKYEGHAWGMAIDTGSCIGCNACVVACQSENNIPVVGKDQVAKGREMHWIRVDRYYEGGVENPGTEFQPLPCMHCETAPCEVVCPVAATVHSDEGLNDMVYNRCVGTKYCSNNCPYKVRRFNFLLYQDFTTPSLKLMRNPDVTVRSRGVMEKCTYCVQRINEVRINAKNEGREIKDGEIKTACQQTCPAEAITFGDINDPESAVSKLKASPRNYGLLAELNTRPRTTYLGRVTNPNPALPGTPKDPAPGGGHHG